MWCLVLAIVTAAVMCNAYWQWTAQHIIPVALGAVTALIIGCIITRHSEANR
jgi:hypothetical protein